MGRTGEQIYRQDCASCHGPAGEGTDEYPQALAGDRSVAELARFISKSMPEDRAEKCSREDADRVAAHIHAVFYSPVARARNKPPRIELARLTVRQYRNVITDLIASFQPTAAWGTERGLRGEYFSSRRFSDRDRVIDRLDPEIHFDFGEAGPAAERFEPNAFSIRWDGSVLAPDTGEYEFVVRTEHAVRLWVNDMRQPVVDAWVKSGSDTEHRGRVFLLGGRVYVLRLEFSKAKQGVDDSKKNGAKRPGVKASIALAWKRPKLAVEVIPQRHLMPSHGASSYVLQTSFPPDDRSVGWERGTAISKEWDEATTEAAIEVAAHVAARWAELARVRGDSSDRRSRALAFCRDFAARAFRRPLGKEDGEFFVDRQFERVGDLDTAVKRVVLLVLMSPRFLYREVGGGPQDAYDVACRLSFALWDSLPDRELTDAAAAGSLETHDQMVRQSERMMSDPRARSKLREFFLQWLKVDQVPDLAKNRMQYPDFDEATAADLRTSLELFLDRVVWSEPSDFRQLFLDEELDLNGRLARLYGADLGADSPFRQVVEKGRARAGVLTHPYLMATFAYAESSSPIHRGVFLARNVLGRTLRPPPEAFAPLPAELHPGLTTRERVSLQTKQEACAKCHSLINPLGFTLEHYDAVGRFRVEEKGRPIDATGSYVGTSGAAASFSGERALAEYLANSDDAHAAFVEQLFHHLVKQPIRAYGPKAELDLQASFRDHAFNIRKLVIEIAATAAYLPNQEE